MKSINYLKKIINFEDNPVILSRSNEKLKYLRKLGKKSFRDNEKAFSIEGTKLFLEACQSQLIFRQIFMTEQWFYSQNEGIQDSIASLNANGISIVVVANEIFNSISTMNQSEGIISIVNKIEFEPSDFMKYVLLDDVQDPFNVGTIIRTADAAGIDCVITSGKTADIYNEKVLRGSMGSVFHIPVIQVDSLSEYAQLLKNRKITIIGTSLEGDFLWQRQSIKPPYAIVMGNESKGISYEMSQLCDILLKIPILGNAESLNVSTAAGIILYDILRENASN
ncbi:MAG: RNA methyltransferase [Eubacteriaceae bacterium]|nr:RNA methyltransferase [Eubacteriaceae bacterium]